jgi:peptide/nickel transport system substrate-binding protein
MFGYDESIGIYEFNLTAAAAYLEAEENPSSPGDSYADTGFEMTFFYNAGNLPRETACQLLKQGLESLKTQGLIAGTISIDVQGLDWPVYLDAVRNRKLPAFFLGWAPDYADPDNYMNPFLHSSGTYALRCSIDNATITAWIEQAAMELDQEVRAGIYHNISQAVYEECYYIWTAQATSFHVERTWVTGYYFNPMYSGLMYYVLGKA